jgi:hypothetical protein
MKRLLQTMVVIATMSFLLATTPDPRGNWKLSGLAVDYLHIARADAQINLVVHYPPYLVHGDGVSDISVPVITIPAGTMFQRLTNGPFNNLQLGGIGVNLNVNVYDQGTGSIAEGSFYPDIELSESQECVTDLQIFSVNENFTWGMADQASTFSTTNVLGMEDGLLCDEWSDPDGDDNDTCEAQGEAWGFGLVTGLFDETPSTPEPERIPPGLPFVALDAENVLAVSCAVACITPNEALGGLTAADAMFGGDATACAGHCDAQPYPNADFGGAGWLHGTHTSSKMMVDIPGEYELGNSTMGQDLDIDFKLVWDAIDGESSGLGFGDDPDVDEDDDGSDFDRIFGLPYITATEVSSDPACDITGGDGFNYPFAGDIVDALGGSAGLAAWLTGSCYEQVAEQAYGGCLSATAGGAYDGCMAATTGAVTDQCNLVAAGAVAQATGTCDSYASDDEHDDGLWNMTYGGCLAESGCTIDCDAEMAFCADTADAFMNVYGDCDGWAVSYINGLGGGAAGAFVSYFAGLQLQTLAALVDSDEDGEPGPGVDVATYAYGGCMEGTALTGGDESLAAGGFAEQLCLGFGFSESACGFDGDDPETDENEQGLANLVISSGITSCEGLSLNVDTLTGAAGSLVDTADESGDNNCDEWAPTVADGFAALDAGTGYQTCTDLSAFVNAGLVGAFDEATNAQALATLDEMAAQSELTGYLTCTNLSAFVNAGLAGELGTETLNAQALATLDILAALALGESCVDYGSGFEGNCIGEVTTANDMYLMNPDAIPATWNFFATFNSLNALQSMAEFGLTAEQFCATEAGAALCVDDSNHDFDPTCLADADPSDCSGRFRLTFQPTCVPEIEARQIVAEFANLDDLCNHSGDVNFSCSSSDWNYHLDSLEFGGGAAGCQAYADEVGAEFIVNPGGVLPSCDEDLTEGCSSYSNTVVWNAYYASLGLPACGDGDPNDLIELGAETFCAGAVPTGAFGDPSSEVAMLTCMGYYAAEDGVPSFEQSCSVGDGFTNVTDIIRIIDHILGTAADGSDQLGGEAGCNADVTGDGIINVTDVVGIVNMIVGDGRPVVDASEATISIENDSILIDADGYIGGVDMIVEFTNNFSFELADNFAADYSINGNKAHIILVNNENITEVLTMTSGKIVSIHEALLSNSSEFVTTSIAQPSMFTVGAAYPNPFNPSTNISLVLNANADLSVKVYNLTGQLVDVIAEGNYSPSTYNWTWKAENLASGVYFIRAQAGSEISTQKVMLLK